MLFRYLPHAEARLTERDITKRMVQESFHLAEEHRIHGGRYRRNLVVDGCDLAVGGMMRATYDPQADALFVYLRPLREGERIAKTREIAEGVQMDFDADGHPLGIEVLWASERYLREELVAMPGPVGFLSLSQAGERTGLSPRTLKIQAQSGRLKAEKHGRNWVTTEAWLTDYLNSRKFNAKAL